MVREADSSSIGNTMSAEGRIAPPVIRRSRGHLLFLPARWQRAGFLVTLKRVHAWTGLWGAALFLLLGSSGFLLNHRTVLPVEVGSPVAVSNVILPVQRNMITSENALGTWARRRLGLLATIKAFPAPDGPASLQSVQFLDQKVMTAPTWTRVFYLPNQKVTVIYAPGSTAVTAKVEALGVFAIVKNLHKGTGLGIGWVLLIDTIAGALIAMSLTGFLLWSRLHGSRLLAGGLAMGSITWALWGSVSLFR